MSAALEVVGAVAGVGTLVAIFAVILREAIR